MSQDRHRGRSLNSWREEVERLSSRDEFTLEISGTRLHKTLFPFR
jgi:hypothetical protein